jgi:hypothetical protein
MPSWVSNTPVLGTGKSAPGSLLKSAVYAKRVWWDAGWKVFGQLIAKTFTLGLGLVVHVVAS